MDASSVPLTAGTELADMCSAPLAVSGIERRADSAI
jgi:hypothetical protein